MFWGLIMDPNKRYTQTVEKAFHVSMASLDTTQTANEHVQVKLCYEGLSYLLCTLQKGSVYQVPLDLNFQEGTEISFTSNGKVHLTGYLMPEDNVDMEDFDEEQEEEEEEVEEEEDDEVPQLVGKQSKRKAQESPKDSKKLKRLKAALKQEEEEQSSDDDEEDAENEDDQDVSLEIDGEAEDDSDEVEDDDEDEEDDSDEEEEVDVKQQQKKPKQKEQQQQANKKQKLVNGKDAKPEQTKQEKKKGKGEQAQQQQQQQQQKKNKGEQQQQQQNNAQQVQKKRVIEGGVQVEDVKIGNGANAKSGKFISVYYVGRLTNGKKFDATTHGEGFKFRLGKGEVIKGWDVGIAGMKIGGKRRITIPPGMAYGAKGSPPVIPGNSTLVFEVELKNVH